MENNTLEEIWKKISENKNILMSLHSGPDGDSFGSCTAMKYILEKMNKKIRLISKDALSENLMNMPLTSEVEFGKDIEEINLQEFDLLLCLDTAVEKMIGKYKENYRIPKDIFTINIDHHPTNSRYGNLLYIDEKAPSACSVLIDLFKYAKIKFDSELSTRLLLGLCTDSGFFTFAATGEKALEEAGFLISHGGKYAKKIMAPILHNQPLNLLKYYSLLVMKLKINEEKKFAYSITTEEEVKILKLNKADIRLGANHLQFVKEFDFIFTLTDLGNEIKGSFRSQKGVDVSVFAKALGGGGHKAAAAFVLPKMPLEKAEKLVLETIKKSKIIKY